MITNNLSLSFDDNLAQKTDAAITIQKYFRGHLVRRALLSSDLFSKYQKQCELTEGKRAYLIPVAQSGKTRVFLPNEMPEVVLKNSGKKYAVTRFHQMQEVRSILDKQNCPNLTIPRARLCKDFLVEERLPINTDVYHNIWLYVSEPKLFDDAVRQMTRLFCVANIGDLVDKQDHPLGHIEDVEDYVRYDNLPLYIEEKNGKKVGKIGLIDLEHFEDSPNYWGIQNLVRIFPLHLEIIQEEAKKQGMLPEYALDATAAKGKKFLQVGFLDHLEWLKKKGVTADNVLAPFEVSSERLKEITTLIEKN